MKCKLGSFWNNKNCIKKLAFEFEDYWELLKAAIRYFLPEI